MGSGRVVAEHFYLAHTPGLFEEQQKGPPALHSHNSLTTVKTVIERTLNNYQIHGNKLWSQSDHYFERAVIEGGSGRAIPP
jgi:hypothetical protein